MENATGRIAVISRSRSVSSSVPYQLAEPVHDALPWSYCERPSLRLLVHRFGRNAEGFWISAVSIAIQVKRGGSICLGHRVGARFCQLLPYIDSYSLCIYFTNNPNRLSVLGYFNRWKRSTNVYRRSARVPTLKMRLNAFQISEIGFNHTLDHTGGGWIKDVSGVE